MSNGLSRFLQRAMCFNTFEYAWLWGTTIFLGVTAVLAITYVLVSNSGFHWDTPLNGKPASVQQFQKIQQFARVDQCEVLHADSPIMERQNTWSNLAYLYVGILIIMRWPTFTGGVFGIYMVILCFCSGLYHASNTPMWQTRDVAGLDAALIAIVSFAVDSVCLRFLPDDYARFKRRYLPFFIRLGWVTICPAVIGGVMAANRMSIGIYDSTTSFIIFVSVLVALIFATLIGIFACPENKIRHSDAINDLWPAGHRPADDDSSSSKPSSFWKNMGSFFGNILSYLLHDIWGLLLLELLVAGFAFFVRLNDGQHIGGFDTAGLPLKYDPKWLCSPHSFIQAHAAWHVLTALALLIGFDIFARLCRTPGRLTAKSYADYPH